MPGPLDTRCPHCKARYRVRPSANGRHTTCGRCNQRFKISAATEADEDVIRPEDAFDLDDEPADDAFDLDENFGADELAADEEFGPALPALPRAVKKTKEKKPPANDQQETKPAARSRGFNPAIPAVIGAVCVFGVGGMLLVPLLKNINIPGAGGGGMQPPAGYERYVDQHGKQFGIDCPIGWEIESGARGGTSNPWARFSHGSALIRVKTSLGASAIAGEVRPSDPDEPIPDELKQAYMIHEFMKEQYAGEYDNYKEETPQVIQINFGEVALAKFHSSGTFGSEIRGLRMSALGKQYQITVMCDCSGSDWEVCEPVFEHVAKSLGRR